METVKLSSRDAQLFMDALANPPKPESNFWLPCVLTTGLSNPEIDMAGELIIPPLVPMLPHQTILAVFPLDD